MASQDGASSFEAMIHADRARKKNEDLANQIFGRSKSSQNVNKRQKQQEPRSPSLASRMGVQKRSSSTSVPTQNKNPFNPPSRPSSTTPSYRNQHNNNAARANRIASEINHGNANISTSNSRNSSFRADRNGETQSQSQSQSQPATGPGLTIKGSAGPFTLLASNFEPGTTEADIEAALYSKLFDDEGNNTLTSCRIVSARPNVVAEMVLTEKAAADKIIRKFHNLKADGRILKVVLIKSGPDSPRRKDGSRGGSAVAQTIESEDVMEGSALDTNVAEGDMEMDEVEITTDYPATSSYDHEREAADRDRRDRDRNRDREDFGGSNRREDRRESDRPREDRDRRRDDRDRDRDRDRDEDRDRDRDRDRDNRERDHRDPAREPHRDHNRDYERRETYDARPQQPRPPPAYGNGFNRPPRGGYGYGNRGGYGFPRGGYGGRGSYRGGY